MKKDLITVYMSGAFGVTKYEGTLLEFGTRKYAQYEKAPFVTMVPKGKRKPIVIQKTYRPYIVILDGIGHPEMSEVFSVVSETKDMLVRTTRYSSFSEDWIKESDIAIDAYIEKVEAKVIADFRYTKAF